MIRNIIFFFGLLLTGSLAAQTATLAGTIATPSDDGTGNVLVELLDANGAVLNSVTTACDGNYSFANLDTGTDYQLRLSKTGNILNGTSTFDLLLFSKHVLGVQLVDNPYNLIAADVNGSGTLNVIDLQLMGDLITAVITELPVPTWQFAGANDTQVATEFPFSLSGDLLNFDFVAIKAGDINNSVDACQ